MISVGFGSMTWYKICLVKCYFLHDNGIYLTGNGEMKKDICSSSKVSIGYSIRADRDIVAVLRNLVILSQRAWMQGGLANLNDVICRREVIPVLWQRKLYWWFLHTLVLNKSWPLAIICTQSLGRLCFHIGQRHWRLWLDDAHINNVYLLQIYLLFHERYKQWLGNNSLLYH